MNASRRWLAAKSGRPRLAFCLLLGFALLVGFVRHQAAVTLPANHVAHLTHDEPVLARIAGVVVSEPRTLPAVKRNAFLPYEPRPRTTFLLDADALHNTPEAVAITGRLRVAVEGPPPAIDVGDRVEVTGWLYRPRGPRNLGQRDWARWNRLQGIYAGLTTDSPQLVRRISQKRTGWRRRALAARTALRRWLIEPAATLPDEQTARLIDVMVLGQRSRADRALNDAFARVGAAPLLAVSGFHVGVLAAAVWLIARLVLRRERPAIVLTMLAAVGYALVAEPNAPILRAVVLTLLACTARLLERPIVSVNWLAAAALLLLAIDPQQLLRPGFQLSFVGVLTLIVVVPRVWRDLRAALHDPLADPAAAERPVRIVLRFIGRITLGPLLTFGLLWLFATPLVAQHFGYLTPWGWLQSLLISPVAAGVIACSLLSWPLLLIGGVAGQIGTALLTAVTHVLTSLVAWLGTWPASHVEIRPLPGWIVAACYLLLVAGVFWRTVATRSGKRLATAAVLLAGSLAAAGLAAYATQPVRSFRGVELHVLDVGDGSAALLRFAPREAVLIDAGTRHNFDAGRVVVDAARALGVGRIAAATVSHANYDHFSGLASVAARLRLDRWYVNPAMVASSRGGVRRLRAMLRDQAGEPRALHAGQRLRFGGVQLDVLWPPEVPPAELKANDRSLVLRAAYAGRSILLPGDIEADAMRRLLDLNDRGLIDLHADVLVAPHHGSVVRPTAEFIAAVQPDVVIVSSGRDRSEFAEVVRGLFGDACRVVVTREVGQVIVSIDPQGRSGWRSAK